MEDNTIYAYPSYEKTVLGEVEKTEAVNNGMTLRDYFAGQAIIGVLSSKDHEGMAIEYMIEASFNIADVMLKERNK